jgi:alkanesulfonate monooxygenase SsuD/methylene tetrahydromethanopterin reductase-like flavin-dependent oxidoreductase (luciferase family)
VAEMTEALEVTKILWTQPKASFCGKYYHLQDATCEPKPLQKPHPPITVGGAGEKYTLRATAQFADRVDFGFLPSIEEYKQKLAVLERHCKDVGRDIKQIERMAWLSGQILIVNNPKQAKEKIIHLKPEGTPLEEFRRGTLVGTPQDFIEKIKNYTDLGVTYFMLYFADLPNLGSLRLFAQKVIKPLG